MKIEVRNLFLLDADSIMNVNVSMPVCATIVLERLKKTESKYVIPVTNMKNICLLLLSFVVISERRQANAKNSKSARPAVKEKVPEGLKYPFTP